MGHDWGAVLTYRVATAHGDRLRSWAADVGNIAHPDYEWHDFAKIWQTPGRGRGLHRGPGRAVARGAGAGFEAPRASRTTTPSRWPAASDLTMGRCILDLYRSATPNPYHHWGPWAPTAAPGLVLHPTEDPFGDEALAARGRRRSSARGFEPIEGAGHFWPYQAPDAAAAVLTSFWAGLA